MTDYCKGFAFPVPTAFYGPLASCRFEQGDVLYSDAIAYEETWGDSLKSLNYIIQVISPIRGSVSGSGGEQQGKPSADVAFRDNSETEVCFELRDVKANKKTTHTTKQGQLYSLLRTGDLSALERPFEVPVGLRGASKELPRLSLRTYAGEGKRLFAFFGLMGTDHLYQKLEALNQAFGESCQLTKTHVSEISELEGMDMNPLLKLFVYSVDMTDEEVDAAVKSVLYKPAKEKKTDKEVWRLNAHGLLTS